MRSIPTGGYTSTMSHFDQLPQERAPAGHPTKGLEPGHTYTRSVEAYDEAEALLDNFYPERHRAVTPDQATTNLNSPKMEAPALPERSALRASRTFDMDTKLQASIRSTELSQATPHDVYLSSEEDASSSADEFDFSDYDWESESDDQQSTRRTSHEDTARVVSVVFMGKPSLIHLSPSRRSVSPGSIIDARRRASTVSSFTPSLPRSVTESAGSSIHHQSPRKSSLVSSLLSKKKPPFLQIDPYANGSTYSLNKPPKQEPEEAAVLKTPKTPTAMFKNMSKTLNLARKRSRLSLNMDVSMATAAERPGDSQAESQTAAPAAPAARAQPELLSGLRSSSLPSPSVTYRDIISAAKKNSITTPSPVSECQPEATSAVTPPTATPAMRRGILGGLTARRRSVKLM